MLIQKTTHSERLKNTVALDQLMFSFFDTNMLGFKRLLADDGTFLRMSKIAFLSKLNSQFNALKEEGINGVGIHKGICVDSMPGCEVFEVRYALSPELLDENGMYFSEPNTPVKKGEVVLKFSFKFKEGNVTEINRTRNYLTIPRNESDNSFNNNKSAN